MSPRLYTKMTMPSPLPGYPARATRYNPFVHVHIIIAFVNPVLLPRGAGDLSAAVSATCTTHHPWWCNNEHVILLSSRPGHYEKKNKYIIETCKGGDRSYFVRVYTPGVLWALGSRSYNRKIILRCTSCRQLENYVCNEPLRYILITFYTNALYM